MKLTPGKVYDVASLVCTGWTDGDGSGHDGYNWEDYFADGKYLGPDDFDIEPLVEARGPFYGFRSANHADEPAWFHTTDAALRFAQACGFTSRTTGGPCTFQDLEVVDSADPADVMDTWEAPWSAAHAQIPHTLELIGRQAFPSYQAAFTAGEQWIAAQRAADPAGRAWQFLVHPVQ